jgi:hypothetical protein
VSYLYTTSERSSSISAPVFGARAGVGTRECTEWRTRACEGIGIEIGEGVRVRVRVGLDDAGGFE